jgi:hypothetical protein
MLERVAKGDQNLHQCTSEDDAWITANAQVGFEYKR